MSVNMLGAEQGDQVKNQKELDSIVKSPDSRKTKKSSPSIQSFFKSKELEKVDNEPVNRKDIQNFFVPQRKLFSWEETAKSQIQFIQDSDNGGLQSENFDRTRIDSPIDVEASKTHEEYNNGSSKKLKEKWSVRKSKKGINEHSGSDLEDFVIKNHNRKETVKGKRRKSKPEKKDVESCNEKKSKRNNITDERNMKERKKKTEFVDDSMGNDNDSWRKEVSMVTKLENNVEEGGKERKKKKKKKELVDDSMEKSQSDEVDSCDKEVSRETKCKTNVEEKEKGRRKRKKKKKKELVDDSMEKNQSEGADACDKEVSMGTKLKNNVEEGGNERKRKNKRKKELVDDSMEKNQSDEVDSCDKEVSRETKCKTNVEEEEKERKRKKKNRKELDDSMEKSQSEEVDFCGKEMSMGTKCNTNVEEERKKRKRKKKRKKELVEDLMERNQRDEVDSCDKEVSRETKLGNNVEEGDERKKKKKKKELVDDSMEKSQSDKVDSCEKEISMGTKCKTNVEEEGEESKKKMKKKKELVDDSMEKSQSDEADSCDKEVSRGTKLKTKGEEEREKKKELVDNSMEKNQSDKVEENLLKISKKTILEEEGVLVIDASDANESKIESLSLTIPSCGQNKKVKSAFDVLMSPKKDIVVDNTKSVDSVTLDNSAANYKIDQKDKDELLTKTLKETSHKSSFLGSSGCGNAFDVLMTKRKPIDDSNNPRKSPKASKRNSFKFKLNIRYSKPLEFEDENKDSDTEVDLEVEHQKSPSTSLINKSKKIKNDLPNEIELSGETLLGEVNKPDVVNITYVSEENLEVNLVEESRKLTKVKTKSKKNTAKSLSRKPIEIQDDSNSSVQEIPASSVAENTPESSSRAGGVIISPGSDDFEVTPLRTGLRKRTNPESYATKSEAVQVKKENEKEGKKPGSVAESPEVEVVMIRKTARQRKEDGKTTEPKKLASIFLKRTKPIQTKEVPAVQIMSTKTTQPNTEASNKPVDEAKLKVANFAFNSLFATCKSTKAPVSAVQTGIMQPAPWPTVSHVTQKSEDQSDEGFWNLRDSKIKTLPWRPELAQDISRLKSTSIELGEFTNSSYRNQSLAEEKKVTQDGSHSFCLSPVVVKNLLSEIASCFPGIPIKRLYKQYKNKDDEAKKDEENSNKEYESSKGQKQDPTKPTKGKDSSSKPEETLKKGRRRPKRKISNESDDELGETQHKKLPRTIGKEDEKSAGKCNEGGNKKVSVTPSRKKRGRDEEEEVEQTSKRKSTRLRNRSNNVENKEESKREEDRVDSCKRKKRKTLEDDKNSKRVTAEVEKSEDSRASLDEKRITDKRELLWTEKYQPECSSEVMGNASSVSRLRSWLEAWKIKREKTLRKELELQKRLLARQKNKDSNEKKPSWREEDQDSDFHLSDEDSCDSDNEESGLCNAMLVLGPKGAGKTATVYACAKELGYKVFEVNCSSKRSSKQIMSRLEEATQSHLVITNPSAKSSAFGGLFGSLSGKPENTTPTSNFFKNSNENQDKRSKNEQNKGRSRGKEKERERGNDASGVLGGTGESGSNPRLSLKAASLILFEEVDVIFEDDKGFWSAVTSFMHNAKCPIIMTSNDSRVDCDGKYEQLMIRSPSINLLSGHLLVAALANNVFVNPAELKALTSWYKCDIRKCLLALQFWILSGAGVRRSWEAFLKSQEEAKVRPDGQVCLESKTNLEGKQKKPSKVGELNQGTGEQLLGLDDPGEESLFLSLDDWKALANRPRRASRLGQSSVGDSVFQNDDSESEPTKPSVQPPMDENTHTDSILDAHDPGDSLSIQLTDENKKAPMPDVHYLLIEHVLGLTNCTHGYEDGIMELMARVDVSSLEEKDSRFQTRCGLAYHSQKMGINLVNNNLPSLLPTLHTNRSPDERVMPVTLAAKESADSKVSRQDRKECVVISMFSDKSIFDDGTPETPNKKVKKSTNLTDKNAVDDAVTMTTDDDTTNNKQTEKQKKTIKEFQGQTLEIFSSLAEDISYMDAYSPRIPTDACSNHTAAFGWWHARVRAGLSDDVVTSSTGCDWLTLDTSACIRGALEVASLECCYGRYKSLMDKRRKNEWEEEAFPEYFNAYLPRKEVNSVVNMTGLNEAQTSRLSSRNKLYKAVSSSLPVVAHCTHRAVTMNYLPSLRMICHTERLREQANTKRRFLHYLDSNSLCLSKSSQQNLADAFLAQ